MGTYGSGTRYSLLLDSSPVRPVLSHVPLYLFGNTLNSLSNHLNDVWKRLSKYNGLLKGDFFLRKYLNMLK
jgi:hypothetical protein